MRTSHRADAFFEVAALRAEAAGLAEEKAALSAELAEVAGRRLR